MYNRGGDKLGETLRERVPSESRADAVKKIEMQQAAFPRYGYNNEHDYWWARQSWRLSGHTRWLVLKADFD